MHFRLQTEDFLKYWAFKGIAVLNVNSMGNGFKTDETPLYLPRLACETHHRLPHRLRGQ